MDQMCCEVSVGHVLSYVAANVGILGGSLGEGKGLCPLIFFQVYEISLLSCLGSYLLKFIYY